jgi:hypothetical protein
MMRIIGRLREFAVCEKSIFRIETVIFLKTGRTKTLGLKTEENIILLCVFSVFKGYFLAVVDSWESRIVE